MDKRKSAAIATPWVVAVRLPALTPYALYFDDGTKKCYAREIW